MAGPRKKRWRKIQTSFVENGLSIVLLTLFVGFLIAQSLAGVSLYNDTRTAHGLGQVGYWRYVRTGTFLQGVFSNWQAAILQLASLIIFGVYLHQRGAPHSRKPGKFGHPKGSEKLPWRGSHLGWFRRNSLSFVFVALFVVAFILHLLSGAAAYNQELAYSHQVPLSVLAFFVSAKFWFTTFQTWQAEYMAIALYVLLSIFLRQEGSPESKPVGASNSDTGDPNK
ncbi:MAG: DUF6766 family protein [Acidobacteriaceae bacterium]